MDEGSRVEKKEMGFGALSHWVKVVFGALTLLLGFAFILQWIGLLPYHSPNMWTLFIVASGILIVASAFPRSRVQKRREYSPSKMRGVGDLVILEAMVSFINLFGGISLIGLSAFLAGGWGLIPEIELQRSLHRMPWALTFTGVNVIAPTKAFFAVMAVVLLLVGVVGFMTTWGIWTGKSWAWPSAVSLSAINLPLGFFFLTSDCGGFIGILINAAIIYCLTRPNIRVYLSLLTMIVLSILASFMAFINWSFYV